MTQRVQKILGFFFFVEDPFVGCGLWAVCDAFFFIEYANTLYVVDYKVKCILIEYRNPLYVRSILLTENGAYFFLSIENNAYINFSMDSQNKSTRKRLGHLQWDFLSWLLKMKKRIVEGI